MITQVDTYYCIASPALLMNAGNKETEREKERKNERKKEK